MKRRSRYKLYGQELMTMPTQLSFKSKLELQFIQLLRHTDAPLTATALAFPEGLISVGVMPRLIN